MSGHPDSAVPPRERYASLDQLQPGDRIWLDGAWREVVTTTIYDDGDASVVYEGEHLRQQFLAPAALLIRRAET